MMNEAAFLLILLLLLSLAALAGHTLRLRREREALQGKLRGMEARLSGRQAEAEAELAWRRSAWELSPDALIVTDHGGAILEGNRAAQKLFGAILPGEGLIARVRDHHLESMVDATLHGKAQPPVLVEVLGREVYARVDTWGDMQQGGAILHLRDVTEMNRLLRARRDMMGNISHELRTPLGSIKLLTGALLDGAIDEAVTNRALVSRIATEDEALIRLVEDLTALNSIETGRMPLHLEQVDLRALVEQRAQRLQPQMQMKKVEYEIVGAPDAPVRVDPERFGQVLTNILDNAIKYSLADGVIRVTITREGETTALEVSDSGPGIMPRDLPRIFERFYKGDRSRTRGAGGTGLGLAIARHLVEAHGGTITARNNDLEGATFRIELPNPQKIGRGGNTNISA